MRTESAGIFALCGIILVLGSCSSDTPDWNHAVRENTVESYRKFLAAHPKSPGASEAKAVIQQLEDDESWTEASKAATTEAYENYLKHYPRGLHAGSAREKMTSLKRAASWEKAQKEDTPTSLRAFLSKFPTGMESDRAKSRLQCLTEYHLHLANESSDDKARRRLTQLKAQLGDQLPDLMVIRELDGKTFSVDSDGMTQQEAQQVCASLKRKHQPCEVVQRSL